MLFPDRARLVPYCQEKMSFMAQDVTVNDGSFFENSGSGRFCIDQVL